MEQHSDPPDVENAVAQAVAALGGLSAVARLADVTHMAVSRWITRSIPAERVLWLAEQTRWQFTPHQLAPLLYPNPTDGLPRAARRRLARSPASPV